MSIGSFTSSDQNQGRQFSLWQKAHQSKKITLKDIDPNEGNATASVAVRPKGKPESSVGKKAPASTSKLKPKGRVTKKKEYGDRDPVDTGSESSNVDQSIYESNKPKLDLKRPKIKLDPFQQSNYYSLIPVENVLTLESGLRPGDKVNEEGEYKVPITSSSVVGESGSGLTLMLAKKAYENYQDGRPTIILAHREHQFHNIAQSVVDFADTSRREALVDNIEVISGDTDLSRIDPSKKIYIVSVHKLQRYLNGNDSFRQHTALMPSDFMPVVDYPQAKVSDILPLNRIRELLVDDVNLYTGQANEGMTKILTSLLVETSTHPDVNPVHLFGTTSTPYPREEQVQNKSPVHGPYSLLQFEDLFPALSRQSTPSPKILIDEAKFYKQPKLSLLRLDEEVGEEMKASDANQRLVDSASGSINDNIVNLYLEESAIKPDKKWHIIADSIDHAEQLCASFNLKGVNAKVATSGHKGYFREETEDEKKPEASQRGRFILNDHENPEDKTRLRKVSQNVASVINDYENGDCNVIIDIDHKSCIHSTKTDKVLVLNLHETDSRTKHLMGEAVRDRSGPVNQSIEYVFLKENTLNAFNRLLTDDEIDLSVIAKSNSAASDTNELMPLRTRTGLSVLQVGGIDVNRNWLDAAFAKVLEKRYPGLDFENAVNQMVNDFYNQRTNKDIEKLDLKAIVAGLVKDRKVFNEFVDFISPDLNSVLNPRNIRSFDLKKELTVLVPDLMGVKNAETAFRILSKEYENLVFSDETYTPDEDWLARLDASLGIATEKKGELREQRRLKLFAEIIAKKFGKEFFENRYFLNRSLKVFTGALADYKLFGLLVNVLAGEEESSRGRGFSFDDIRKEFPHLLGSQIAVPFATLQRKILAKYPDGPPLDQDLTRFFREQLYDDFAIDFSTLVNSVTNHSRETDQEIIDASVQDEIYKFLEASYREAAEADLPTTSALRPEKNQFDIEIKEKAQDHLSSVTREILYHQLISKIWGLGGSARINNDNFVFQLAADELAVNPRNKSEFVDLIDLTKINPDLALAYDHVKFKSSFDRVDIKERLANIVGGFLIARHSLSAIERQAVKSDQARGDSYLVLKGDMKSRHNVIDAENNPKAALLNLSLTKDQEREMNVLLGAVNREELTANDKKLLRDFFQVNKINLKKELPRFYDRLGVENLDEAKVVVSNLLKFSKTKNEAWVSRFSNQHSDLVAKFIYEKYADSFNDPQQLHLILKVLSGDMSSDYKLEQARDLNREFIEFANQNGLALKTEELILDFKEQIGLKTKEELFVLMNQPDMVNFDGDSNSQVNKNPLNPNAHRYRSNQGVEDFVEKLAERLDMPVPELFALAGLSEPASFYREPVDEFKTYSEDKLEYNTLFKLRIDSLLNDVFRAYSNSIKSRQLLSTAFGEKYKRNEARFEIYAPVDVSQDSGVSMTQIITNSENASQRFVIAVTDDEIKFSDEFKISKRNKADFWQETDFRSYKFSDSEWKLESQQEDFALQHCRSGVELHGALTNDFDDLDPKWLEFLGLKQDSSEEDYKDLQNLAVKFLNTRKRTQPDPYQNIIDHDGRFRSFFLMLLGHKTIFNSSHAHESQDMMRDFINFVENEDHGVKGFEKLNLEEVLKTAPKLVGVKSMEELKTAVHAAHPDFDDLSSELLKDRAHLTADHLIRLFSRLTATPKKDFVAFPEIEALYQKYREGMDQLELLPDEFKDNFTPTHIENLKQTFLLHSLYERSKHTYHFYTEMKLPFSPDSADADKGFELRLVISAGKIQYDILETKTGEKSKLVKFQNLHLNQDEENWEDQPLDIPQHLVRNAFMNIFRNEVGHSALPRISAQLNDAYDEVLTKGVENDSLFLQTSNLMTEFLLKEKPELFEAIIFANENLGENESAPELDTFPIIDAVMALLGIESHLDPELINKFIDFAKEKHPEFESIRNNPQFKEIFFGEQASNSEKFSNYVRATYDDAAITRLINEHENPTSVFAEIFNSAVDQGIIPSSSLQELIRDLGIPGNILSVVQAGFDLFADSMHEQMFENGLPNGLNRELKSMPDKMPTEYRLKYESLIALKTLFPSYDFSVVNTENFMNMIPLDILDPTGKKIEEYDYSIEFDGRSLMLWKRDNRDKSTTRLHKSITRLLKVDYDLAKDTWSLDQASTMPQGNGDISDARRIIDHIRSNISQSEAFDIYKNASSAKDAYDQLLLRAKAALGLQAYDAKKVSDELKVPFNLATHLKD
jgi:hypothetical protein